MQIPSLMSLTPRACCRTCLLWVLNGQYLDKLVKEVKRLELKAAASLKSLATTMASQPSPCPAAAAPREKSRSKHKKTKVVGCGAPPEGLCPLGRGEEGEVVSHKLLESLQGDWRGCQLFQILSAHLRSVPCKAYRVAHTTVQ